MRIRTLAGSVLALVLAASAAHSSPQRFSLETLRKVVGVGSSRVSPDGRTVAFIVTRPDYDKDEHQSELYVVNLTAGPAPTPRALTFERRHVSEIAWSPDGSTLSFLAPDDKDQLQIWLLPFGGGESRRFTHTSTGVQHYAWRPDGGAIAYAAPDTVVKRTGEPSHLKTFTVGAQDLFLRTTLRPQHIWVQPLGGEDARRLTGGDWSLEFVLPPSSPPSHLSWSPDGKSIAFARVPAPESGKLDSVSVAIVDVESGQLRALTGATRWQSNPAYSPDGRFVTYWFPREGRGDAGYVNELHMAPAAGGEGRSLTHALDRMVYNCEWMPGGRTLLVAANDRTTTGLWLQAVDGPAKRLEVGDLVVNGAFGYDFDVASTGAIVFSATTGLRPSELYVMDSPTAKPRRLTNFNAWVSDVALGRTESVMWRNDGLDENGVLVTPPDFDPTHTYPLVLVIHGGPTSASKTSFSTLAQLMASEGWCVFMPNYRGSDNLGNAYQSAIHADWGPGPGRDVMAGIAELRKRPYVDKTRTAVTGWSYGGYMTSWLIGNYPNEWQAAVAGAPVTSWEDQYNFSDGNISLKNDLGGSPWVGDREAFYKEQSPITFATRIRTPTRVMANIEDFRVPPTQAMSLYRAMKDNGVETDFIAFEGRTHASSDPVNARERTRLWIEWVRNHLNSTPQIP
jgi:dipeptidyl aminopeptidase/acylaminoacyl peptidase